MVSLLVSNFLNNAAAFPFDSSGKFIEYCCLKQAIFNKNEALKNKFSKIAPKSYFSILSFKFSILDLKIGY